MKIHDFKDGRIEVDEAEPLNGIYVRERTCRIDGFDSDNWQGVGIYSLSCGHVAYESEPMFCPECGAKVVVE